MGLLKTERDGAEKGKRKRLVFYELQYTNNIPVRQNAD
jgi:hypothetical protein